jgi:NAD(P)H-hydrate epimerase
MRYAVNSKEMKLYDNNTTEHYNIPSVVLMERAALSFAKALCEEQVDESQILVVCGKGNNGADGLAIARLLLLEGKSVDVVMLSGKSKASAENELQQKIFCSYGGVILDHIPENKNYTLIVDALFGVGLSRIIDGDNLALIEQMNLLGGTKAAVDIASGVSSDNGNILGCAFRADITVTFSFEKIGQLIYPGNEYSGRVILKRIGIDENSFLGRTPSAAIIEQNDLKLLPGRISHSNKGTYGKLLIIAGSVNMAGAAVLCAKAAYAVGTGLVRVLTPEENRQIIQTAVPEAILTVYSSKKPEQAAVTDAINWADAIVCGPGIGTSAAAESIVMNVLKSSSVPVLFDADALNIISKDTSILLKPHTDVVVTPHLGEMSRLTGDSISYIQNSLISEAMEFANQYNLVCVLKDERTVIGIPYRNAFINMSGNNGMATAGSGDVLSGVIGALMAQGEDSANAASLGVFIHGLAGDEVKKLTGVRAMTASDIIEGLRLISANETCSGDGDNGAI